MEHQSPTATEPYHIPLMVPQFPTEAVMRERLVELGHRPEFGCELVGFQQDGNSVAARIVDKGADRPFVSYSSAPMAATASRDTRSTSDFLARHLECAPLLQTSS